MAPADAGGQGADSGNGGGAGRGRVIDLYVYSKVRDLIKKDSPTNAGCPYYWVAIMVYPRRSRALLIHYFNINLHLTIELDLDKLLYLDLINAFIRGNSIYGI